MSSAVLTRFGVICLLVYQAIFLNIVLPGHTRGAITLPGTSPSRGATIHITQACCPCCCRTQSASKNDKEKPSPKDRQNCALCHLAARISLPPTIDLSLIQLALVDVLPPPLAMSSESVKPALTYLGRAPPKPF